MATQLKVTYRDIAKMLAKALPIEGADFGAQVEENIQAIKAMPTDQRVALRVAYVFSSKVPREEREDFFQDLTLALLSAQTPDERLAYTIARADWKDFWGRYKTRQHYRDGRTVLDVEGEQVDMVDLLTGACEYEKLDSEIDGKALIHTLPQWIQDTLNPRNIIREEGAGDCQHRYMMDGKTGTCECGRVVDFPTGAIDGGKKQMISKWVRANPSILVGVRA
ncbi:hypothetical protein LCGC14_3062530 [marine sediment metagenome]|uniref:Uncharacterized protein n=1 Tax=marine sediment metagenome TaxID=412755 RepID=A0A0F8WIC1_9ZZZZ